MNLDVVGLSSVVCKLVIGTGVVLGYLLDERPPNAWDSSLESSFYFLLLCMLGFYLFLLKGLFAK